jgi:hypothetical protein
MTAGLTTRSMEGSRISLPRVGLGVLLVSTLLAGGMLGAAIYAGISASVGSPSALTAPLATSRQEPAAIRQARIEAGSGPLVGDAGATRADVTARQGLTSTIPYRGDGFGGDGFATPQVNIQRPAGTTTHASGHGPLR